MSDSTKDLEEFNSLVAKSSGSAGAKNGQAVRDVAQESPVSKDEAGAQVTNKMWAVYGGRNYSACEEAVTEIAPGQYTIKTSDQLGIYFSRTDINLDNLVHLPDSVSEEVIHEIQKFWTKEAHFRKFGFLWKRGILAWGPPGSGKTSCLQIVSQEIIQQGGISVYVENPKIAAAGLKILRQIEPKRPILVMLEDIDSILDVYGEATLLALMDGELQIDNVVFVATTNYPERLDKRFVNRPSRFDLVKKIGMPNVESRELFFRVKNPRLAEPDAAEELKRWIQLTDEFSIAHMKELIVSVEVFEVPLEEAAKRLLTMMNQKLDSSQANKRQTVGFS